MNNHPHEELSAYADGELSPEARLQVETHLRQCTECTRELSLMTNLGRAMRNLETRGAGRSLWTGIHQRITRPIGWGLLTAGILVWVALAVISWFSESLTLEWLAATAIGTGLVMLMIHIGHEQYREWKTSPYKEIH